MWFSCFNLVLYAFRSVVTSTVAPAELRGKMQNEANLQDEANLRNEANLPCKGASYSQLSIRARQYPVGEELN